MLKSGKSGLVTEDRIVCDNALFGPVSPSCSESPQLGSDGGVSCEAVADPLRADRHPVLATEDPWPTLSLGEYAADERGRRRTKIWRTIETTLNPSTDAHKRYVAPSGCSCDGLLVADTGGTPNYPIWNGHGDVVGTADSAGNYTANPTSDEFGRGATPSNRLGWLGTHERFVEQSATGIIRMGLRLYDPNLGRFLQADPIPGGSANDYDYANADPINGRDLAGLCDEGTKSCIMRLLTTGTEPFSDRFLEWGDATKHHPYIVVGDMRRRWLLHGACSAPKGGFNFKRACQIHDLGYDLMRFYGTSGPTGTIRRAVDALFRREMKRICDHKNLAARLPCYAQGNVYQGAVDTVSAFEHYGVPK